MDAPAQGGGVAEALVDLDAKLAQVTKVITSNAQLPDEVKADFAQALQSYRSGLEKVMQTAGGEGPQQEGPQPMRGAVAPEAGANPGAVPVSPAGVRK